MSIALFVSCDSDDDRPKDVIAPTTYVFERNGNSTVSFGGQTTRIQMANELGSALKDNSKTEMQLDAMFDHTMGDNNFSDPNLNAANKSIRSKVAASKDFFASNSTDANEIKNMFDSWIESQVDDVFPSWDVNAEAGVAGQL